MWIKSTAKILLWYQLLEKNSSHDNTDLCGTIWFNKHGNFHQNMQTHLAPYCNLPSSLSSSLCLTPSCLLDGSEKWTCVSLCWCAKLPKWTSNWLAFILSEETCLLPRDTFQRTANRPAATRNRRLPITSTAKRTGVHLLCACNR